MLLQIKKAHSQNVSNLEHSDFEIFAQNLLADKLHCGNLKSIQESIVFTFKCYNFRFYIFELEMFSLWYLCHEAAVNVGWDGTYQILLVNGVLNSNRANVRDVCAFIILPLLAWTRISNI